MNLRRLLSVTLFMAGVGAATVVVVRCRSGNSAQVPRKAASVRLAVADDAPMLDEGAQTSVAS
jgi:hypothetical protein